MTDFRPPWNSRAGGWFELVMRHHIILPIPHTSVFSFSLIGGYHLSSSCSCCSKSVTYSNEGRPQNLQAHNHRTPSNLRTL
jgi:hypothetical protein